MVEKQKAQSGQALLLVIFVVLIISTLSISLINLAGKNRKAAFLQHEVLQATYTAEAGIEKILAHLKYDKKWRNIKIIPPEYAGGNIIGLNITEKYPSGYLEISSTGQYGHSRKTLKTLVNIKPAPIFDSYNSVINAQTDAEGNISGDINLSPVLIDEDDKEIHKTMAQSYESEHYLLGNAVFSSETLEGIRGLYYINGNVMVSGDYSGRATIVATGDITITSNLTTSNSGSNSLALISYHNINIDYSPTGTAVVNAVLLSAGRINLNGNVNVIGSIVSSGLSLNEGTLNFQYSRDLVEQIPPGLPAILDIISWQEGYPII